MTADPRAGAAPPTAREPGSGAAVWTALWLVYVIWGSTYLAIAVSIASMPPLVALGTRFLAAAALMALYLVVRRGPRALAVSGPELRGAAVVGVLLLGAGIGFLTLAERSVPTGVAALIVAVVPLWVVLLRRGSGDRPARVTWLGVFVGLAGVAVLVLPGGHVESVGGASAAERTLWSVAILVGSACWAIGSFLQKRITVPRDDLVLSTYQMLVGGLSLCAVGLLRGEQVQQMAHASTASWVGWAYLVTIGSLVGYTAYVWLVGHAPLSLVTTYAYVNPVVAVALGTWLHGEALTSGVVLGGAIVVAGVVLVVSAERPGRKPG